MREIWVGIRMDMASPSKPGECHPEPLTAIPEGDLSPTPSRFEGPTPSTVELSKSLRSCERRALLVEPSEIQLQSYLDQPRRVLLSRGYPPEVGAARIGIGRAKAGVIESIEHFQAKLQLRLFGESEVFEDTQINLVHSAGARIAPTGRIAANEIAEVLIDSILDVVRPRRLIIRTGHVEDSSPSRIARDVCVFIGELDKV